MAYDEGLAEGIRELVASEPGVSEKRMFGGLAFLVGGHMAISASRRGGALVRVDPQQTEALIDPPHVNRAVMGGREMDGWLRIDMDALGSESDLARWVTHGVAYARSLPAK